MGRRKIVFRVLGAAFLAGQSLFMPTVAQALSQPSLEGLWIGRFFGSDDAAKAVPSFFCGAHRSPLQDFHFRYGRVHTVLSDTDGYSFELAGAFVGRNFIGEVRVTGNGGLELLGPARGVVKGTGEARISFNAKDLGGKTDQVCNAIIHLKKGTGAD